MRKKKALPTALTTTMIDSLAHDGRGVAHIDGKAVFVLGALPGEQVTFQYTALHGRYDEGQVVEVLQPNPTRALPRCEYVNSCGGCSLQHIQSQDQIHLKQKVLTEQLQHFGGQLSPTTWLPVITGDVWGYRRKARFSVRYVIKKDSVLVGFREKNGRYVADINDCAVLHPQLARLIPLLRVLILQLAAKEHIPQIEVALGNEGVAMVIRHLVPLTAQDSALIHAFAREHSIDCYLQPKGIDSIVKFQPPNGEAHLSYSLPDFNLTFRFHPLDFVQVNETINQRMVAKVIELLALTPDCRVLDLFCGLGNFTLPMAKLCAGVVGVEGDEGMVQRGYENSAYNQITNVNFYACDLTTDITQQPWAVLPFDKVLLDPPRSGAAELMPWLVKLKPKRIVYVSCNPATLARDAGLLVASGKYRFVAAGVMDMFAHTTHVESMAIFDRL